MKVPGIYKITSPSGKVYIGQSWSIYDRWIHHKSYAKRKRNLPPKLSASILKYGPSAHIFSIEHELPKDCSQEVMDAYEIFYYLIVKS